MKNLKYLLTFTIFTFLSENIFSQEDIEEEEVIEEVVVTGSRISTSEFTGAQPVIVIDQAAIQATGEMSISCIKRNSNKYIWILLREVW